MHSEMPIDAATIVQGLQIHSVRADEATVFRILRVFIQRGLAQTIQFHEDKMRFEYAGKPPHHHFVCEQCGSVILVSECNVDRIEKILEKTKGVKVTRHTLEFFGVCARCRKKIL